MSKIKDRLSFKEIKFLENNGIGIEETFDVSGMKQKDYKKVMKDLDKKVAVFANPCTNGGHRLKDKHGHCVECKPHHLLFAARHYAKGYIYIAGTLKGEKIKIGYTKDYIKREDTLNSNNYGGYSDWKILYSIGVKNAGKIESQINEKLKKYSYQSSYVKESREVTTYEMFQCSFDKAKNSLKDIEMEILDEKYELNDSKNQYNFQNTSYNKVRYTESNYLKKDLKNNTGKISSEIKKINDIGFKKVENVLVDDKDLSNIEIKNENIQFKEPLDSSKINPKSTVKEIDKNINKNSREKELTTDDNFKNNKDPVLKQNNNYKLIKIEKTIIEKIIGFIKRYFNF